MGTNQSLTPNKEQKMRVTSDGYIIDYRGMTIGHRYYHYSFKSPELTRDEPLNPYMTGDRRGWRTWVKPQGLWIAEDPTAWPRFCAETYNDHQHAKYKHIIDVHHGSLLWIGSIRDALTFTEEYGADYYGTPSINWEDVMYDHDGIYVNFVHPYIIGDGKYTTPDDDPLAWLHNWDIKSGCVWNYDAIMNMERDDTWQC